MLICRPDQSPLHILNEKLSADPARVVLRPFHLAWASNVPAPSRAAQLVADIVALDEDQAELELGLIWKDFSERHWQIGKIFDEIGRASCRERVCQYVKISVVAVSLKKTTDPTYNRTLIAKSDI